MSVASAGVGSTKLDTLSKAYSISNGIGGDDGARFRPSLGEVIVIVMAERGREGDTARLEAKVWAV